MILRSEELPPASGADVRAEFHAFLLVTELPWHSGGSGQSIQHQAFNCCLASRPVCKPSAIQCVARLVATSITSEAWIIPSGLAFSDKHHGSHRRQCEFDFMWVSYFGKMLFWRPVSQVLSPAELSSRRDSITSGRAEPRLKLKFLPASRKNRTLGLVRSQRLRQQHTHISDSHPARALQGGLVGHVHARTQTTRWSRAQWAPCSSTQTTIDFSLTRFGDCARFIRLPLCLTADATVAANYILL